MPQQDKVKEAIGGKSWRPLTRGLLLLNQDSAR